jgi:hypothetical protein
MSGPITQRRWSEVFAEVFALRAGVNLSIPKSAVVHPRDMDPVFRASSGLHQEGVIAHWRCRTEDDRCIHALETSDAFLVHWDRVDPNASLLGHLFADAPEVAVGASLALGAGLGASVGKEKGALVGGLAGLILGLLVRLGVQAYEDNQEATP